MSEPLICWHCDQPVLTTEYTVNTPSGTHVVCCPGCLAAVNTIHALGLDDYYQWRTTKAEQPNDPPARNRELDVFSVTEVWRPFARQHKQNGQQQLSITLSVAGIRCAACVWLLEKALTSLNGVESVRVNLATHKLTVSWLPDHISLATIAGKVMSLGYGLHLPASPAATEKKQSDALLGRLLVAALGTMQAMMYAFALYTEGYSDLEIVYRDLFRWFSFLVVTPVVFYSGSPILVSAWHSVRARRVNMDVPVSVAVLVAWTGSLHATLFNGSHVYFESAAMFVFFLTLTRWLEARQQDRADDVISAQLAQIPQVARRYRENGETETIHLELVAPGDELLIEQGDIVPVDADIISGNLSVSEAVLTGESALLRRQAGDNIFTGSKVLEGMARVRAGTSFRESRMAQIYQLAEQAQGHEGHIDRILSRVATAFVPATLILGTASFFLFLDSGVQRAIEVALSVLVITCPCALSLAVPLARAASVKAALNAGILVTRPDMLYRASHTTRLVMDKTGTLTRGEYALLSTTVLAPDLTEQEVLSIAAALEQHASHPVAHAFKAERLLAHHLSHSPVSLSPVSLSEVEHFQGGVSGCVQQAGQASRYTMRAAREASIPVQQSQTDMSSEPGTTVLELSRENTAVALFFLSDRLRPETETLVRHFRQQAIHTTVLSGDTPDTVAFYAQLAGVDDFRGGCSPEDKFAFVRALQQQGNKVLMVGDGVNDGPVLAQSDVSVAMENATALSRNSAGLYLLQDSLSALNALLPLSAKMRRILKQNLFWAATYNLTAVPLALLGMVAPWQAALGMSLSSLLVTLNAARMHRPLKQLNQESLAWKS